MLSIRTGMVPTAVAPESRLPLMDKETYFKYSGMQANGFVHQSRQHLDICRLMMGEVSDENRFTGRTREYVSATVP